MLNKILLLGRLVADPELRYTATGKAVAQFTLAVDRPFAGQDGKKEADFIPVILWGKTAEAAANYSFKGQRLLVEGRLQIRSYEAKDGSKRWATEVIGNSIEFIEKKESSGFDAMGTQVLDEELPFQE